MAIRIALNRSRSLGFWGYQRLVKGNSSGFVDAKGMILAQNGFQRFPSSMTQFCRHYFLPPPPPYKTVEGERHISCVPVSNYTALPLAEFAVKTHNEHQVDDIVRLARVVRASRTAAAGVECCITLEAVNEKNGELNVYYAIVLDIPYEHSRQLISWKLVDHSFHYPFMETRLSKQYLKQSNRREAIAKNNILSAWLCELTDQARTDKTYMVGGLSFNSLLNGFDLTHLKLIPLKRNGILIHSK